MYKKRVLSVLGVRIIWVGERTQGSETSRGKNRDLLGQESFILFSCNRVPPSLGLLVGADYLYRFVGQLINLGHSVEDNCVYISHGWDSERLTKDEEIHPAKLVSRSGLRRCSINRILNDQLELNKRYGLLQRLLIPLLMKIILSVNSLKAGKQEKSDNEMGVI